MLDPIFFNLWNTLRTHEGSSIDAGIDIVSTSKMNGMQLVTFQGTIVTSF